MTQCDRRFFHHNRFKYITEIKITLPQNPTQLTKSGIPKVGITILAIIFGIGLFIVGFDQGHFFSIVQGEDAFIEQFLHEFTHDMRHAAGFPCH